MNTAKSLLAGLLAIVSVGINFVQDAPQSITARHVSLPVSSYRAPERLALRTEPTIVLPEMRITPTKGTNVPVQVKSKRWECKAPRHLEQGPVNMTVKECEYR